MNDITFRVATLDDSADIVRLINAAFRPATGTEGWTSEASLVHGERTSLNEINRVIQQPSSAFILGLRASNIVACYHIDGRKPEAYLGMLAVDPTLQNSGIGKAIRSYTEDYAYRVFGATSYVLLVLAPRKELIAFYKRNGYQHTGRAFAYPANMGLGTPVKKNLVMVEMHKRSPHIPGRKLNILFSHQKDWQPIISRAFEHARHTFTFADLTPANILEYDLVVPLTIADVRYLSGLRHLIPDNPIPIPSLAAIELCDDKLLFNKALTERGFGKFVPKMRNPLPYPYILKKRIDEWGVNSHIIANQEQELLFTPQLADPEYFRQIFIPGPHQYATHILFKDQKIVYSMSIKYTYGSDNPIQGKDKIKRSEVFDSPYLVLFASILSAIGFEGLCCFDYKVLDNRPFILEINPRFGASLGRFFHEFLDHIA